MLWWFLILGVSSVLVGSVVIALYLRVRRQMKHSLPSKRSETGWTNTLLPLNLDSPAKGMPMSKAAIPASSAQIPPSLAPSRSLEWAKQAGIVIAASLFVALCARVTVPLPFTPVPLTMQNFGVLAVGLMLGSRRGFAALALYLAEGAMGLPVFSPSILGGGIAQILGPTGGFLMAYPLVALIAGWIYEKSAPGSSRPFAWAALSSAAAELVLFAGGLSWLALQTHSIALAIRLGLYWFIFAEVIKVMMAAAVAARLKRVSPQA